MTEGKWVTPQGLRSNEQLGYSTRHEPEYEYAIKGTTRKLREAEAAIQRVRELADTWMSDGAAWGPHSARCILNALDGDA